MPTTMAGRRYRAHMQRTESDPSWPADPLSSTDLEEPPRLADARDPASTVGGSSTVPGPWGTLAERWVPEPLRGARVAPGRRGMALLTLVAALAALIAAAGVWWTRPNATVVPPRDAATSRMSTEAAATPDFAGADDADSLDAGVWSEPESGEVPPAVEVTAPGAQDPAPPGATTDSSADQLVPQSHGDVAIPADGPIFVSVTGKVRRPGLVSVFADARVADAIAAAGGVSDLDDLIGINLAAPLRDGASIVVGGPGVNSVTNLAESNGGAVDIAGDLGSDGHPDSTSPADALVNINTADATTLQLLPGVGPVTAEAIIAYRAEHGPFVEAAQLQEVSGIGPATFARISSRITW